MQFTRKEIIICTLSLISLTLILSSCSPNRQPEEPCGYVQNSYGERISWKKDVPIAIHVHSSFPTDKIPILISSFQKWESHLHRKLFEYKGVVEGPISPRQDGNNIIYWMDSWESNKSTEQGRTTIYWKGDRIIEADIRVNHKNFTFYDETPEDPSDVHLESLLVHELGHVLGLKHEDDNSTVMQTYLSSHTDRSELTDFDINSLKCEY